tara:strand:+ start:6932 stop:7243 length:312 start_codon:yes stop_codon:yes gene_type:complete
MSDMLIPKGGKVRDEAYRRHVATDDCRCCGRSGTQAAHVGHSSMGKRDHDWAIVALCPECHAQFDGLSPGGKELWFMKNIVRPELEAAYMSWLHRTGGTMKYE